MTTYPCDPPFGGVEGRAGTGTFGGPSASSQTVPLDVSQLPNQDTALPSQPLDNLTVTAGGAIVRVPDEGNDLAAQPEGDPFRPAYRFRIGSAWNGYIYERSGFTFNQCPVYICERGSGDSPTRRCWLYRAETGFWICVEADVLSADPILEGVPWSKTSGADIEDISAEGVASWNYWNERIAGWQGRMPFAATRV